ncbi:ABC transporter permease [Acetobacterium tundrae]|uniref:ABC-2 type transporter transmembrane domain-containing protein n=1 Tax=Acetobacterium tundrae TaxID=132932 RepID=A0ABR6WJY8_9FIRM|nr:ABC transporter permease [Acetobacterium tundrae]MBC3796815.1 hypothetical protein [Acetobacterium tundrae]
MISILKNDLNRLLCKKFRIVLTLTLTTLAIMAAIFINTHVQGMGNIALVTENGKYDKALPSSFNITITDESPAFSELVSGKYDAIITDTNGTVSIETIKNDDYRTSLQALFSGQTISENAGSNNRGIGTRIIGYLMMFMLLEGVVLMYMFADDKEKKQITRVAVSPLSMTKYLFSHSIFTFLFIFIPTLMILYIVKFVMAADIGFSLPEYILLLGIISAFATAFSLFLNALASKSETANMMGSAIVILTTMLSGSFYSFEKGNALLENIISVLPQKAYLTFVGGLESGLAIQDILPSLFYLTSLGLIFFIVAIVKTKKDYVNH